MLLCLFLVILLFATTLSAMSSSNSSSTSSSVNTSAGSDKSLTTDLTSLLEIVKLFNLSSSLLFVSTPLDNSSSPKANSAICNPFIGFIELSVESSFVGDGERENI